MRYTKVLSTWMLVLSVSMGLASNSQGQTKPSLGDKFIFFIDGANVQIPILDGLVVSDPLDPTSSNFVFEIPYAGWAERGFRWPTGGSRDSVGVDASGMIGENYGESDTLYVRLLSDPSNKFKNDFIGFIDSDDGIQMIEDPNSNLPFRVRWRIPSWAHDGQWHDFAIPLPPATYAQLDSAKAGKTSTGENLGVVVDSLFSNWEYGGAWAQGSGFGVWTPDDPSWEEFDWESVKYFGRHVDHAGGGGPLYLDYFSFGVKPEDLMDAAPAKPTSFQVVYENGKNNISWVSEPDAVYELHFSEAEITDVTSENVVQIAKISSDISKSFSHEVKAPHILYSENFTSYYALTRLSDFGTRSEPLSLSITSDLEVEDSYVVELSSSSLGVVISAIVNDNMPDSAQVATFFPEGYIPFSINEERKIIENGSGGDDDSDISGEFWIGYSTGNNELVIYSEIMDDKLVFASASVGAGGAWNYDSWDSGLGNYEPESFIIPSTHTTFQTGDNPDYQIRGGGMTDRLPFVYGSGPAFEGEIPNSATIVEHTDTGYRTLTMISTIELSNSGFNRAFSFPESDEVALYPLNISLNDNDGSNRDTQISWSKNAGGDDWWNNPTRWQAVAFVGKNKVTVDPVIDLSSVDKSIFIGDTLRLPFYINLEFGAVIDSFEVIVEYDTTAFELTFPDQLETLAEEMVVVTNSSEAGVLQISGASTESIFESGILFKLQLVPKSEVESSISITGIKINEVTFENLTSEVIVIDRVCGDVTDDKTVSALDAVSILRHTVLLSPEYPLTGLDSLVADVTANGFISAYDASLVLQYQVGLVENLNCLPVVEKTSPQSFSPTWELVESDSDLQIKLKPSDTEIDVYSTQIELMMSEGINFREISNLPRNWTLVTHQSDDKFLISMFGITPLTNGELNLEFKKEAIFDNTRIEGEIIVNESNKMKLDDLFLFSQPNEFALSQNYPNPFNPSTNIQYSLPEKSKVDLAIFNMLGQRVAQLVNNTLEAGNYTATWNAGSLSSGVYIYRLTAGDKSLTKRMMLIK